MTGKGTFAATALRMLCMLAVVLLGFSHQPALAASALTPAEIAAHTLPDGTLPDLCAEDMVHGKEKHAVTTQCEACRIGSAMLLPLPADLSGAPLRVVLAAASPRADAPERKSRFEPGAPPRAPPFLSI